ncbi:sugar ABC transporter permease [Paenibacillus chitinolyticus]|uniref:ABC transporter permease subunit n=1 Tax=Paenibacillus chitinolyticus TaxID=79263 RepID=A0A410WW98_9BACL|nr:ABC transporter permease subunit [Paenibacillus chitinolyticus]MCY9593251.1 ABC transporter permease subunit [Paenibacillus chitinolyticus]MCY9597691.1 ABC transporter permease subunit [Paenibacillus chitinolyticus]QAV18678.1 sugar ABC transporter permease [Paenibacillus chitinolyticus]
MRQPASEVNVSRSKQSYSRQLGSDIRKDWDLYLLLVPGILFVLLFKYTPMYGLVIAFKDFNIFDGMAASPWVGLEHFKKLFTSQEFGGVFVNTLIISLLKIVILFPLPIVVAILMNEMKNMLFKRTIQTVIYLPHFLSWVIVSGIFIDLLSTNGGLVNKVLMSLGLEQIAFFMDSSVFRSVLITSAGWKETGWGIIVYLAAFSTIDPQLYEAAKMDGAGRLKQIWHITLPGILPTILLMFILRLGSVLEAGTEQILVMYNPTVYNVSDVIGTFVYRMGLGNQDYSFTTAVGLFESVIAFSLVITGNYLSRRYLQRGIW